MEQNNRRASLAGSKIPAERGRPLARRPIRLQPAGQAAGRWPMGTGSKVSKVTFETALAWLTADSRPHIGRE